MLPERPVGLVFTCPMSPSFSQPVTQGCHYPSASVSVRADRAELSPSSPSVGQGWLCPRPTAGTAAAAPAPSCVTHLAQGTEDWQILWSKHKEDPSTHAQNHKCQALSVLAISPVFYFPCLTWYKWEKRDNNRPLHPCARQSPTIMETSESWNIWIQFHTLLLF